jgi:hypothetical protein
MDDIFIKRDVTMLKLIPLALLAAHVLKGTARFGQSYLMAAVAERGHAGAREGDDLFRRPAPGFLAQKGHYGSSASRAYPGKVGTGFPIRICAQQRGRKYRIAARIRGTFVHEAVSGA